jgi:hypothetical protein
MLAWWARKQYLSDKTNMKALFPKEWTGDKYPHLLFSEMPEAAIREQFQKDIATAASQAPRVMARCPCADGVYPGFVLREDGADVNGNPYRVFEPCPSCMVSRIVSCCDTAGAGIAEGEKSEPEGAP